MAEPTKPAKECNGIELRMRARQRLDSTGEAALVELEHRRDNLHRAVIPAWEKAARGEDPADWDLVR
jgi:hypothetical protein